MTSRTRWIVLLVSTPLVAFVVVGGLLGRAFAKEGTYPAPAHLRRRGLADRRQLRRGSGGRQGDDRRDARAGRRHGCRQRLSHAGAGQVGRRRKRPNAPPPLGAGSPGLELTRGYYLRVIAARDGSSAAKAGLHTGDYIRAIEGKSTRTMSALEGMRLLRGAGRLEGGADRPARQRRRSARRHAGARSGAAVRTSPGGCRPRASATCASRRSARACRPASRRRSTR